MTYNKNLEPYYHQIRQIVKEHCRDSHAAADIVSDLINLGLLPTDVKWALKYPDNDLYIDTEEETALSEAMREHLDAKPYYMYSTEWTEYA